MLIFSDIHTVQGDELFSVQSRAVCNVLSFRSTPEGVQSKTTLIYDSSLYVMQGDKM